MFAKLLAILLSTAATACGLLVMRQQRIDIAHDMARTQRRIVQQNQMIWKMRVRVHEQVTHESVLAMIARYEAETGTRLKPLLIDDCVRLDPAATLADRDASSISVPRLDSIAADIVTDLVAD